MLFVTPAYAQAAGAAPAAPAPGGMDMIIQFAPIVVIVIIFYFLMFRPQQKKLKEQRAMLSAITRGDTVVTSGGIVGKVTKAVEGEDLEVEIAPNVKIRVTRGAVTDVRSKGTPVNDNKAA